MRAEIFSNPERREFDRVAGCQGKQAFQSPQLAFRRSVVMNHKRKGVQIYRCAHCGFFHIGTRGRL